MINRHSSSLYPSIVRERFLSWDVLVLQSHQYSRHTEACLCLALISLEHYTLQIDPCRTTNVGPEFFTLDCFELLLLSSSSLWNPSAFHLSRKKWHRPPSNGWLWAISVMNSQNHPKMSKSLLRGFALWQQQQFLTHTSCQYRTICCMVEKRNEYEVHQLLFLKRICKGLCFWLQSSAV